MSKATEHSVSKVASNLDGSTRADTNELGRIASGFYVSHTSMGVYNQHLKSATGYIELFRIFSLSEEFKNVPVRAEEKCVPCSAT